VKKVVFFVLMWTFIAIPIGILASLLFVSTVTYDIVKHPQAHKSTNSDWSIATDIYSSYEMNIWQSLPDCVQFDHELLYIPSHNCAFKNKEFSTNLTFSDDGRITNDQQNSLEEDGIFFLGDSVTMGWGVNDDETFSYLIGSKSDRLTYNLGVSSYGTVREIILAKRHPKFENATCMIIQYSWNDFDENREFLELGALPIPSMEKFNQLVEYKPQDATFLQVVVRTFEYMRRYKAAFFTDMIGLSKLDYGMDKNRADDAITEFVGVLDKFHIFDRKTVFVIGPEEFIAELKKHNDKNKLVPVEIKLNENDRFTLDKHPNRNGHINIATQLIDELSKTEEGRRCLFGQ
jgi:hypothetical protein